MMKSNAAIICLLLLLLNFNGNVYVDGFTVSFSRTVGTTRLMAPPVLLSSTTTGDSMELPATEETRQEERLMSWVAYDEDTVVTHRPGSMAAATALVAGTAVGAGILALPAATAPAGFVPSTIGLTGAWIVMLASGLLLAERTLGYWRAYGQPAGLLQLLSSSSPSTTSGEAPKTAVELAGGAAYFFLHYAIMVAYIAQGGNMLGGILGDTTQLTRSIEMDCLGPSLFVLATGGVMFSAPPARVEQVNNVLVTGVALSFLAIVGLGSVTTDWSSLLDASRQHPEQVVGSVPILFLALVYQNVVPTVVAQLEGDRGKIRQTLVMGTTAPFIMFVAWNAVVLGNVAPGQDVDPVALLQQTGGDVLGPLVSTFSGLALVTSLIGFTYGLLDAWTDVLGIEKNSVDLDKEKVKLYALIFVPPLALSVGNPGIFYQALEYGGAFGVSTLFLVLPPLMIWRQRYGKQQIDDFCVQQEALLPGEKIPLVTMLIVASGIIGQQLFDKILFPLLSSS